MPNPTNNGKRVGAWHFCDRCGEEYRLMELTPQKGLLVCPNDVDNLIVEQRPRIIQEVLSDGTDELTPPEFVERPTDEEGFDAAN